MKEPLVSIIMPVYNAESYVKESVLSVFNQSYRNIELICVDDFSTDNSYSICMKLSRDLNIRVYKNDKNRGQEYTRNYGINKAKGKYITFLDADDKIDSIMIKMMVEKAEETEADIVIGTYSKIINNIEYPIELSINEKLYNKNSFINLLLSDISFDVISCIGSKLYNLSFLKSNNVKFDNSFKYNEDLGFSLTAINKTKKIYYINYPFYKYLIRKNGSVMSSYRPKMYTTIKNVWIYMKKMFIDCNIYDEKKDLFLLNISYLMINSLFNEAKFKGYRDFYKTSTLIRKDALFIDVFKTKINRKHKLILLLIKCRFMKLCYYLLKINIKIKRKKWGHMNV